MQALFIHKVLYIIKSSPHPTKTSTQAYTHTHMQTHSWITLSLKHVAEFRRARSENIITGRRLHWTPLAAQSQGVYTCAHTAQRATDHRPQTAPTEILENKNQKLTCLDGFRDHVCSFDGAGWLGVKQRTRRTFFFGSSIDPLSFRKSLGSCPWIKQWALRWPWAGTGISGDCVVERYRYWDLLRLLVGQIHKLWQQMHNVFELYSQLIFFCQLRNSFTSSGVWWKLPSGDVVVMVITNGNGGRGIEPRWCWPGCCRLTVGAMEKAGETNVQ